MPQPLAMTLPEEHRAQHRGNPLASYQNRWVNAELDKYHHVERKTSIKITDPQKGVRSTKIGSKRNIPAGLYEKAEAL